MNKEVVFQPWAVRYHHNHPDKTVGNAKAITVGPHMLLAPPPPPPPPPPNASTSENAKHSQIALKAFQLTIQLTYNGDFDTPLDRSHTDGRKPIA